MVSFVTGSWPASGANAEAWLPVGASLRSSDLDEGEGGWGQVTFRRRWCFCG